MSEPHAPSYYAASVDGSTRYPRLEGTTQTDICVVGGGFSGVATALTLAERGYKVALVESNRIGWGASGRNGGQLIGGISGEAEIERQHGEAGARMLRDIRYRGHDIIMDRIAKYKIDCDLKRGWMEAAARPKHMVALRKHYAALDATGDADDLELVEPQDMGGVLATSRYHGGLIDRRSGHLHPLKLIMGEARAASELGVKIYEDTRAVSISGGTKPHVITEHGRIDANAVVLGGEIYEGFNKPKLSGLMFPTGSYIIATEPLGNNMATAINPRDLAVADTNIVLDYFRLSADKRMLFGGRCNYSNRDPGDIAASLMPRLTGIFLQLSNVKIDFAWGGRIGIIINRVPAIGRIEPNLYYMQGYCGHGVNATHIAAEIVADAISGTTEKFDLFDNIRHVRLPLSGWAGNQLLALGMLYYRLKDRM
jgi:gamma-glutamylputrescine oxidase